MSPLTGSTAIAGIIGWPVEQSRSPAIHNAAFAATSLDWIYVAFPVPPGEAARAVGAMRSLGIRGLNVTMPHKHAVIEALDQLTPEAERVGAVNTISAEGNRLIGDNTDSRGFANFLRADAGVEPKGMRALVLGAGGAAQAVALALVRAGAASVVVAARRVEQAEAIARGTTDIRASDFASASVKAEAATAGLIVNATPLGMDGDAIPLDPSVLEPGQVVVDLVYHPQLTPLVRSARARGLTAFNGLGMLVHQAALSFEAWTGVAAPLDAMRAAVS